MHHRGSAITAILTVLWGSIVAMALFALVVVVPLSFLVSPSEKIVYLQPVDVRGNGGELLYLGYKTSTFGVAIRHVSLPVYLRDDGYVLGVTGSEKQYYRLTADNAVKLQKDQSLPTPLPRYAISFWSYLSAFSGWAGCIVTVPILVSFVFLWRFFNKVGYLRYYARRESPYANELARMYLSGNGVRQDDVEALKWFWVAASVKGDTIEVAAAVKACNALSATLTREQISLAIKMAREECSRVPRSS